MNLAGTIGGTAGDAAADVVTINGDERQRHHRRRWRRDVGLGARPCGAGERHATRRRANDTLVINGLGGNDGITATTLPAGVVKLTLDGGAGNDTILGSQGADTILGGDGNDFVFGDNGNDVALTRRR